MKTRRPGVSVPGAGIVALLCIAGCAREAPTALDGSTVPLRLAIRFASGAVAPAAAVGTDSIAVLVFDQESQGGALLASTGTHLDSTSTGFALNLDVPYRPLYRIAALVFGDRTRTPFDPLQHGLQFYAERMADASILNAGQIALTLDDAVPLLDSFFVPAVGYRVTWPRIPNARAYRLKDFECVWDTTVTDTLFDWPTFGDPCLLQAQAVFLNGYESTLSETVFRSSSAGRNW